MFTLSVVDGVAGRDGGQVAVLLRVVGRPHDVRLVHDGRLRGLVRRLATHVVGP